MIKIYNEQSPIAKVEILTAIGEGFFSEGFTLKNMSDALKGLDPEEVVVDISSPGGSVYDALAIHDMLRLLRSKVTTNVIGPSASAATVIAAAGDIRTIHPNATYQIHQVMTQTEGNVDDHEKTIAELVKYDKIITGIYQKITGKKRSEITKLMKEDRPLTAEEALEWGFITKINKPKIINMKNEDVEKEMEDLKSKLKAQEEEIKDLKAKLKAEKEDEDEKENLKSKLKTYEEKEEEENKKAKKAKAEAILGAAPEGVITDDNREEFMAIALDSPERAEKIIGSIAPAKLASIVKADPPKRSDAPDDPTKMTTEQREQYVQIWAMHSRKGTLAKFEAENPQEFAKAFYAKRGIIYKS